jgi:serine/threonine-protein kinase HipA
MSVALGNLDMHAKNVSLLHARDGRVTLAPSYDVVPQTHLPNDGELALAVGGVYRHAAVTRNDLEREFSSWGLRDAETIVDDVVSRVLATLDTQAPDPRAHAGLRRDIERFTRNLAAGRPVGAH